MWTSADWMMSVYSWPQIGIGWELKFISAWNTRVAASGSLRLSTFSSSAMHTTLFWMAFYPTICLTTQQANGCMTTSEKNISNTFTATWGCLISTACTTALDNAIVCKLWGPADGRTKRTASGFDCVSLEKRVSACVNIFHNL